MAECEREDSDGCESRGESNDETSGNNYLECAVCLQSCIHPVQLPCGHIFCFLCVKGTANQSKRCAMCRREMPADFLDNPNLVCHTLTDELGNSDNNPSEDGQVWFYEGRNGWWQYDERTSSELEMYFKKGDKTCEVLIAGFLYVVDFENMVQMRRNDPCRRRRIKRDEINIPKKGVAGLRLSNSATDCDNNNVVARDRIGDGTEGATTAGAANSGAAVGGANALVAHITRTLDMSTNDHPHNHASTTSKRSGLPTGARSPSLSPVPPNNTPQTPHTPSGSSARSSPEAVEEGLNETSLDETYSESLSETVANFERLRLDHLRPADLLQDLAFSSEEEL